ncbi:MAG: hypothetical protein U5N53_19215 [Mycobacterium sp.]|nr:hypothetical protein [Mycobacterium sp.]
MHAAIRPYLATGVALVGAASIAVMPVQPSNPLLSVPAVPAISSQAFTLTAQTNPIALWASVVNDAIANIGVLGEDVLSDPAPAVRQLLKNQLGYLGTAVGAGTSMVDGAVQYLTPSNPFSLPAGINTAVGQLRSGQIAEAFITLSQTLISTPVGMIIGLPLAASGLLDVPVKVAQHLTDALSAVLSLNVALPLLSAAMGPALGAINSLGESVQDAVQALGSGRLVEALTAVINIPAQLTAAILNGYTDVNNTTTAGFLTFSADPLSGGLLQTLLVTIPRAIATALGAAPAVEPAGAAALSAASAPPAASATVVTLSVSAAESPAVAEEVDESTIDAESGSTGPDAVEVQAPVAAPDPEPAAEIPATDSAEDVSAAEPTDGEAPPADGAVTEPTDGVSEDSEPKADETDSADSGALDAEADDAEVADAKVTGTPRGAKSAKDGARSAASARTAKRISARG